MTWENYTYETFTEHTYLPPTQIGLHEIRNQNVCSYFQTVLHQLNSSRKLDWTTYGSLPPDNSLLNDNHHFWKNTPVQFRGDLNNLPCIQNSSHIVIYSYRDKY